MNRKAFISFSFLFLLLLLFAGNAYSLAYPDKPKGYLESDTHCTKPEANNPSADTRVVAFGNTCTPVNRESYCVSNDCPQGTITHHGY